MALTTCKECGQQVSDKAERCPHCGAAVQTYQQNLQTDVYQQPAQQTQEESPNFAIAAIICALTVFPVGLVLGIMGLKKYKTKYRGLCIAAIVIFVLWCCFFSTVLPSMLSYIDTARG